MDSDRINPRMSTNLRNVLRKFLTESALSRKSPQSIFEKHSNYLVFAGITLLMLAAIVIFGLSSRNFLRAVSDSIKDTTTLIHAIQKVLQRVSDAETGERGYLLTQNDTYLVPFREAQEQLPSDLKQLRISAQKYPNRIAIVEELIRLVESRYRLLDKIVQLDRAGKDRTAMAMLKSHEGHRYMESIRDLANRLVVDESAVLHQRFRHDAAMRRDALFLTFAMILASVALWAISFYLIRRDMRLRQVAQQVLRESESQLRLILDSSRDYGIFVMDVHGNIKKWSGGARRLKGYSDDDILGKNFAVFYTEEDVIHGKPKYDLEEARRAGRIEIKGKRRKKDGHVFWADVVITAMHDEEGDLIGFSEITRDITPQVLTEQALQAAKKSAEQANATKTRFVAFISHELRTPLGSILGFADLGLALQSADSEQNSYLRIIKRNANQLITIINDLLDLSKIEAGRLEVNASTFSIFDFAEEIRDLFLPMSSSKGVELELEISEQVPPLISTDQGRLKQVITNLIGNALKFTAEGRVQFKIHCPRQLDRRNEIEILEFDVVDTGIGIPVEAQKRIFDPYFQADKATTQKFGGTGLGLALSRSLARALGGDLNLVRSTVGAGSHFRATIRADLRRNYVLASRLGTEVKALPAKRLLGRSILVVDDSKDTRSYLRSILESAGAKVEEANDGVDAIERCKSSEYDTVLMDIQMPRCDGMEAARIMKLHGYAKPLVALTAQVLAMMGDSDPSLFEASLFKPVQSDHLLETVVALTNAWRAEG